MNATDYWIRFFQKIWGTMRQEILLHRYSSYRLNPERLRKQLKELETKLKKRGKKIEIIEEPNTKLAENGHYRHETKLVLDNANKYDISSVIKAFGLKKWEVSTESAEELNETNNELRPKFILPKLTKEILETHFARIYEREAHIEIIYKSAYTAVVSDFRKRRHVLLYGKPAVAKSEICLCFKEWFEAADGEERVLMLDATTATKAGIETLIMQRARDNTLPEFICIEEIEKVGLTNFLSLLSVMDHRSSMSRTNARIGSETHHTPCVIWATCNDVDQLKDFNNGALFSRFSHRLFCQRPSIQLLKKILLREIEEIDGDPKWVEPVLRYTIETLQTDDPREAIALLDGRDGIMDGSWFQLLEATREEKE